MALTVAQLVARLTADTSSFYRGMAVANSAMLQTGGLITRVAAGAGLATLGMGIMSVRAAGNFQESMNIVQAVSSANTAQFKALRDEAVALGRDMKLPNVSAKDAAQAMAELSKAGLGVKDVLGATRGTLQFGIAANIGFADSAAIVARALTAFGLRGSQATRVADLFTAAANKSTASAQDIALGFQMASAQFKAGDQSIQGLTTSLALMANAGIVGSDAGTSLKTMMNRLMAPTDKAKDLMGKLGFEVYDAQGNMKSMPNIIASLNQSLQGMSKEQRNAALYTIFGSDAIRASRVMLSAGEEGWRKMERAITKGGEAQAFAEARTKGFNGALGAFGSAVETVAIALGTAMLPALTTAVRAMANWVNGLDTGKIIGFFSAIKDGVVFLYNLIAGSDALQFALSALLGGFVALYAISKLIAIFNMVRTAWLLLNASLLASPLGIVALAIGAVIAALVLAYVKIEAFRNAVNAAFDWIKANVIPIMQQVADAIRRNWDQIKADVTAAVNAVVAVIRNILGPIISFVRQNQEQIKAVFQAAWTQISIIVRTMLGIIKGIIDVVMGAIRGDWGRVWDGLKTIVGSALTGVVALAKNILTGLAPALLSLALAAGRAVVTGLVRGTLDLTVKLLTAIKSGVSAAVSAAAGWAVGAAAAIGRAIIEGAVAGVRSIAGSLASAAMDAVKGALGSVKGALGIGSPSKVFADEVGKPIAQGIIEGFLLGSAELPTKISDTVRAALERGKAAVEGAKSSYSSAFSNLANDAMAAFDATTNAHMTKSEKILDKLVSQRDKEEFKRRMNEAKQSVADAKAALDAFNADPSAAGDPAAQAEKRKQLERDLMTAEQGLDELKFQQKKANLERLAVTEDLNYQARRALQKRHLQEELTQLEAALIKYPEKHATYQKKIIALLNSYGVTYKGSGRALGVAFAEGLEESIGRIEAAAARMAGIVSKYLKLRSPAEKGPLSDLDTWWDKFGTTLVSGLNVAPITQAASAMAGLPYATMGAGLSYTGSLASAPAGYAGNTTIYQVQGSLITERQLDERIREGVIEQARVGRTV